MSSYVQYRVTFGAEGTGFDTRYLHSLFYKPLIRIKRIIHVTNITELAEYVLLPNNDDGLTELAVDKGLIKKTRRS